MRKKFFYFGNGFWRSYDSLGRVSQFYTWEMIRRIDTKLRKKYANQLYNNNKLKTINKEKKAIKDLGNE